MKIRVPIKTASITILVAFLNFSNLQETLAQGPKRYLLKNGLTVLIEESHKSPLVAIEAQIKTGSATEQSYLGSGISHFVEHMLFKGTKKWPRPGDIEKEIKSLGGYINGFTSHDSTGIKIIVPSAYLNNGLEITREVLTQSLFDPDELEKEREVILKEIKLNNDEPARYISILLWSNMFKTHNYRFPVIGHEEIFKRLKRGDLVSYYNNNYIPDNIVLGIVGDIDSDETFKTIEDLFGNIERASPPQICQQREPPQITQVIVEEERDLNLTYLAMGFHSVSARNNDMFALDVLSIVLGNGEDSRLFKMLYKQKEIVYSIGSFNYTPKEPGIFGINAVLKKENLGTAIDEIWNQIEGLKRNLISDKELKKAKNAVLSSYLFSRQTVQDKARDLVSNEIVTGDYDFSRKYVEGINAVTKETVREAAQKYLKRDSLTLIKLIPRERARTQEEGKASAEAPLLNLSNLERFELKNGLRVFILPDQSLPIVSLDIVGKGGLRTENFKNNGIANLVAETLLCGTKVRSEEEIFSQIEGAGSSLGSYSGSNTFGVSASGLSKDFNLISEVFLDVLKNPEFPLEKIKREKSVTLGEIKAIDDNIYHSGIRTLKYTLFRNHPYRFQATGRNATISGLSKKEISDYYRTYYTSANMVLAVSGDIDKKSAKEKITGLFGKLEERPLPKISPPKEKKRRRARILTRNSKKEQSLIMVGYLGATLYSHDKYVLEVLASVLSGVNGRLSKTIREEKGLAYTLNVVSFPGIERGMIIFYIGTTKENLKIAREELFKEIGLLKKEGVNDEELKSAKRELVGLHKMGLQKIQDIAGQVIAGELYGLGYDNFLKYEDRINHITKECVLRTARKYLGDDSYVLLTIRGE